ncbi:unnamed protein product [Adineta ricciae]|uniref:G-protein coupled receptors family 1 profile domain-containing protein n=1 Tax=Adineta ricciae TaxID=249248 RepID=A0A815GKG2_ADIRI|nr:unnamed protein product [Adineta ricciae]CAF1523954.1 unnamed protein product [Adineta ricciae]
MNTHNQTSNNSLIFEENSSRIGVKQRMITISLLGICLIPSFICFLFIFYYFIRLRKTLLFDRINHHVILCILICDFLIITTELPFTFQYLSLGYFPKSNLCPIWIFWDYTSEALPLFLTMYASIERYFLVFHKPWIINHKILFHYIPMAMACLYTIGINSYLVLFIPCEESRVYDVDVFVCGGACYFSDFLPNIYDTIVDVMVPPFIILIFNLLIIVRVIIRRRNALTTVLVPNILRKNRRMILQLLAISLLSLAIWMPWVVITLGQDFYDPSFAQQFIDIIIHYLPYFSSFVSPFLALIGLPEIQAKFKKFNIKPTMALNTINPTNA